MNWVPGTGACDKNWAHAEYILDEHGFALARVAYQGYLSGLDRKPVWRPAINRNGNDDWYLVGDDTTDKDEAKRVAESMLDSLPPRQLRMF